MIEMFYSHKVVYRLQVTGYSLECSRFYYSIIENNKNFIYIFSHSIRNLILSLEIEHFIHSALA